MKTAVGLVLLAVAGLLGYRAWDGWRAYKAYEGFAEAWVLGNETEAGQYADEKIVRHALREKALRGTPGGAAIEAYRGTRYSVESKSRSADGEVVLEVRQTIQFDPPGVTSGIGGAMYAHFRHRATVRKTEDGWRVVAFEPEYEDMGSLRPRGP